MSFDKDSTFNSIPVTHFASGDLWGGAEALLLSLAAEQSRRRPGLVRCVLMNSGRLADELLERGIPALVLDESRERLPSLAFRAAGYLSGQEPSVIHGHREKENLVGLLAGILSRRAIGYISTVHGLPEPVVGAGRLFPKLKRSLNALVLRIGYDAIVGVSNDISNQISKGYRSGRVHTIHNGVSGPISVAHGPAGRKPGPLRLLALGRLVPVKRYDRLRTLSDQLSGCKVGRPAISLFGEGPLESALRESFGIATGARDIQMLGYTPDTSVPLAQADALVITSDHEGLPMAALEALSLGVPVFAFSVGGLPELADEGIPLRLSPAGDTAAMAKQISNFFAEVPLGSRFPPPASWKFGIRHCADAYEELYWQIAAN